MQGCNIPSIPFFSFVDLFKLRCSSLCTHLMLVYLGLVILEVCKELFKCVFFIDRNFATKIYLRLPIQDYVFSNIYILIQNKLTYKFLYDFLNEYAYILLIHSSNVTNSPHNIGKKNDLFVSCDRRHHSELLISTAYL